MADDRIEVNPSMAKALGLPTPISRAELARWLARESGLPEPTRPETQDLLARLVLGTQALLDTSFGAGRVPEFEDSEFFHYVARSIIPTDGLTLAICTSELSELHTTLKQIGGYGEDWMVGLLLVQLLEDALVKPVAFLAERLVAAGHLSIF